MMASVYLDQNGHSDAATTVEQHFPPGRDDSEEAFDEFLGAPEIPPRIGDEYQVQITPVCAEPGHLYKLQDLSDAKSRADSQQKFLVGLSIPLARISLRHHMFPKNVINTENHPEEPVQGSPDAPAAKTVGNEQAGVLVPGLCTESWSEVEKASFLLALYIFQKDFVEVRRFVETKDMGSVLSFYYGKFYGSDAYRRWSDGLKTKSKKCVYGVRIFSGSRQQELLSRILPKVPEECRNTILEVSKTFGDDKISFADCVFSLKATVGVKVLVEAVGIGTGKRDLTGMALEPARTSQAIHTRPEIPTGKACSSLTPPEIVKFLNGDYRLSKARSNDLFWEAVWPRLLARGWHSEQHKDQGYVPGFKNSLVFLMPGIKKFSRRKLVKGDHYFDSVTDVLNKVSKDPSLIELDSEQGDGEKAKEECNRTSERTLEQDDNESPTRLRHFYLQPRIPNRSADFMKFTVVDTSLSGGKVRELRSFPSGSSNMMVPQDHIKNNAEDSSEETTDESETINSIKLNTHLADEASLKTSTSSGKMHSVADKNDFNASYQGAPVYPDVRGVSVIDIKSKKDLNENKPSRKVSKSSLSRNLKRGNIEHIASTSQKSRKITACCHAATSDGISQTWPTNRMENGLSYCCSSIREFTENVTSDMVARRDKLSSTRSAKGSPSETVECPRNSSIYASEPSVGNLQTQTQIDLNMPQVSAEFEVVPELSKEPDDRVSKPEDHCSPNSSSVATGSERHSVSQSLTKSSANEARSEQQPIATLRRHGTRNRPPTTRALEALADGYLTVNRKRKGKGSHENLPSRPSQRARSGASPTERNDCFLDSRTEATQNVTSSGSTLNIVSQSEVPPDTNEDSLSR